MDINLIILALLAIAIVGYLIMVNVIYYLSPTVPRDVFPKRRFGKNNCTRIAENPNRGEGMKPLITSSSLEETQENAKNVIMNMPRTNIVTEKNGFMHFVQITPVFRFYDDIFVKLFIEDGKTTVWLQSQSRLGLHDLMVNERRIKHIYSKLKELT